MMDAIRTDRRSDLLDSLNPSDRELIESRLHDVHMAAGDLIYEVGSQVESCYFPVGPSLGAFFIEMEDGMAVETILVGREGAMGGVVSSGNLPAYSRSTVVHGGIFRRIAMRDLEEIKDRSPAVNGLFCRYADCVMAQVFQSIACNAVHTIEQRAAKWLSATVERIGRPDVMMTQEQLASIMGIGRSYASRVLQRFKQDGLLRTRRGGLEILDVEGLRSRACSCNEHVNAHFAKVMGGVYP